MQRLNFFRRLRGKMTLTYTAVTGGVFLCLWIGLVLLLLNMEGAPTGTPLSERFFNVPINDITPHMLKSPPDDLAIQVYLDLWISGDTLFIEDRDGIITASYPDLRYVAVMDAEDKIVAIEPQALPFGPIHPHLPSEVLAAYQQIGPGGETFHNIIAPYQDEQEAFYVMLPLTGTKGELVGKILMVFGPSAVDNDIRDSILLLGSVVSGFLLICAIIMGTLFGWLASARLARRIRRLDGAAQAWAAGDFSVMVRDPANDELGDLGRNLNHMARDLDSLLVTRTGLAAVEERSRLARDLHDTVKQQIFAASMQLSSARELIRRNPAAADEILAEMERLNDEVQTELTSLINALRPAALTDKGLVSALREYAGDWSQRTGIKVELLVQQERALPLRIEQELYRVAQEGLANVAKHAQATEVIIRLSWQEETIILEIQDDGIGFDIQKETEGFGLQSMNDRLSAISGLARIESQHGQGTRITANVELNNER